MNIENESLPVTDDVQVDGPTEQELLDAVLANTEFLSDEDRGVPLPDEELDEVDPAESEIEDPEVDEDVVSEDDEEEIPEIPEEAEGEDAVEETATQEPDVYTADDLDLEALVTVKVDGEEMNVSFADLLKGYQTDAHLSKKGREISEAQAAIEEERTQRLSQLEEMGSGVNAMLTQQEQYYAKQYHEIEKDIEKARADGDTYEVNELKDKREQAQKNYHAAKQRREGMMNAIAEQRAQKEQEVWQAQLQHFAQEIPKMIPDFNEEVAGEIRQFAIDEGINPAALDQITDPVIVKFVDDYRRLKQGINKGQAKRKAVPAKKAVPSKKGTPAQKKKADAEKMRKARAFKENASKEDQDAWLKDFASKSLNL